MAMTPGTSAGARAGGWRLASATSAYLRGAHEQAVEWYPWGDEPFALARRIGRPLLLDIGAVWCHWCHVMDEGTYSDVEVARLINLHFVAVKVDRDEHPEIDRRYQRQVGALTGEGGWPLTAFLTPDGAVFLGGTYFPPQDGMGRPGMRRVLKEVARLWEEEREKIDGNVEAVRQSLERLGSRGAPLGRPSTAFVDGIRSQIHQSYDPVNGGFGHAPKFPHPTAVSFLLLDSFVTGDPEPAERARTTLTRMALGGMYDQLGGGFHRYSVDESWHIPHFEKMGIDNAALLSAYVEGARRFADPLFAATARGTMQWIMEVLGHADGGFSTSQDADNAPGDDGSYFTWSRAELKAILDPEEARLVGRVFGVGSEGRMPHDPERNVLFRLMSAEEAAEGTSVPAPEAQARLTQAMEKMREARQRRPAPFVDPARYAGLNGSMIRALVAAGTMFGATAAVHAAQSAADRILANGYRKGVGVAHRPDDEQPTGYGLLEDQADFALGLTELAAATLEPRYLEVAHDLLALIDQEFRGEDGLLRDLAPSIYDGPKVGSLPQPSYPLEDNPHLAANSAAMLAFLRFAALTGQHEWIGKARALLPQVQRRVAGAGIFAASVALVTGLLDTAPARLVVEGSGPAANALRRAARSAWHPHAFVFEAPPPPPFSLPDEMASATGRATEPRALLCLGTRCLPPITRPEEIGPALQRAGGMSSA